MEASARIVELEKRLDRMREALLPFVPTAEEEDAIQQLRSLNNKAKPSVLMHCTDLDELRAAEVIRQEAAIAESQSGQGG